MQEQKTCTKCGKTKLLNPTNFQWSKTRRSYGPICKVCLAIDKSLERKYKHTGTLELYGNIEDWAKHFRAGWLRPHLTGTAISATTIDYDSLRAIMQLQEYMCPLEGEMFVLPAKWLPSDPPFKGWKKWRENELTPQQQDYTPALVRVDTTLDWRIGNLIFISELWYAVYTQKQGLKQLRKTCARIAQLEGGKQTGFRVPTLQAVEYKVTELRTEREIKAHMCQGDTN